MSAVPPRIVNYPAGVGRRAPAPPAPASGMRVSGTTAPTRAHGQHTPGQMNKTEAAWAQMLAAKLAIGEVAWWGFEAVKLRLGEKCFYSPDFLVRLPDGSLELHEVKGHMEDDARVKLSVCASMYPFLPIRLIRRDKGGWLETML